MTDPAIRVGIRRDPDLDPTAPLPASDPALVARIADEINALGPMTFARFMALALYDPEAGYYARPTTAQGPGRSGDFLTAPEGHPIFGWSIARFLEASWKAVGSPGRFVVREHGAGTGALAVGILDGLRRSASALLDAVEYQAVDVAPARRQALEARLADAGLATYLRDADADATPAPGAVIANELLDALPVHRVQGGPDGALFERFVTLGPGVDLEDAANAGDAANAANAANAATFDTVLAAPSTLALAARLAAEGIALQEGQPAEICLEIDAWLAVATAPLERGVALLIDYGYPAGQLYEPARGSTLRAYHRHRVHADPFVAIGRQDLTAHVDLTAVERAARAAGLDRIGRTTQGPFLAALEAGELLVGLQSDPTTTLASYVEARSALMRMLDPRATGAFAVLAFGRGLPPGTRLPGFDGVPSASEATARPDR
ncbi:MAG TPA: SAM-dependent methyltransferase [Candidatus Limnocylindrales bacterium]|nr:SAM-dependent methyltransferase [Candidatus Limnocylindrales bacterium]